MSSLFADENVPLSVVLELRALGHDVVRAIEAGLANQKTPDEDILNHAVATGRAVLTNNRRHFHRLHRLYPDHAGIVTFSDDDDEQALAARIHDAIDGKDLTNALIRVIRPA